MILKRQLSGASVQQARIAPQLPLVRRTVTVLLLERGTWWTTPVTTVQDKNVDVPGFLEERKQPVQFWPSVDHFKGLLDIFLRCVRREKNEDGLYDFTFFGKRGLFGLGGSSDGVSILRASGVGGGSLVYSNITIQPPDLIFEDPRWPTAWTRESRNAAFELARNAITLGVLAALDARDQITPAAGPVNTGLSNIVLRTAGLPPNWTVAPDPNNPRGVKRIVPGDAANALWIDRARIFQTAMSALTKDFGTVDSSINDIHRNATPEGAAIPLKNYCERQGRCNVGCLPGARQTLNKQLMRAIYGGPGGKTPDFPDGELEIEALAEVDVIRALPAGGYEILYLQRDKDRPWITKKASVRADRVIVAAGCVGTTEIMLRSKERKDALPNLSDKVGFGFSTNGDYLAFLEETDDHVSLTRGPVTTSFGHFNTDDKSNAKFHTLEDQGIPPALATLVGSGVPLLRSIGNGRGPRWFALLALFHGVILRLHHYVRAFLLNERERQPEFRNEAECVEKMMCVVAMGREKSVGRFTLGKSRSESALRLQRTDGKQFHEDPIYDEIRKTLQQLADKLSTKKKGTFVNPFLTETADALGAKSIVLTHPLGGCIMAKTVAEGVVNEFGRVFDKTRASATAPFYEGLYIADASIIPTALGVNPSLTISALALRVAQTIIDELPKPSGVAALPATPERLEAAGGALAGTPG